MVLHVPATAGPASSQGKVFDGRCQVRACCLFAAAKVSDVSGKEQPGQGNDEMMTQKQQREDGTQHVISQDCPWTK